MKYNFEKFNDPQILIMKNDEDVNNKYCALISFVPNLNNLLFNQKTSLFKKSLSNNNN